MNNNIFNISDSIFEIPKSMYKEITKKDFEDYIKIKDNGIPIEKIIKDFK